MNEDTISQTIDKTFNNQYTYIKILGEGSFAIVHLIKHNYLDEKRAIKIIKEEINDNNNIEKVFHEVQLATRLRHPNIISIHDAGILQNTNQAYFILEYVNGGDLEDYRNSFIKSGTKMPISLVLNIIRQITEGLNTLHTSNPPIIHRDLKTGNILITYDNKGQILIKISDFGFATEITRNKTTTDIGGTIPFMAPECFDKEFTTQTDVYAVGVIFYLLLTQQFPYHTAKYTNEELISKKAWKNKLTRPTQYNKKIPKEIEEIVLKCLDKDKTIRYDNAHALLEAIDKSFTKYEEETYTDGSIENNEKINNLNLIKAMKLAKTKDKLNDAIELLEKELIKDYSSRNVYTQRLKLWKSEHPDIKLIMKAHQITLQGKNYNIACDLLLEAMAYNPEIKDEYESTLELWTILAKLERNHKLFDAVIELEDLTKDNKKIHEQYSHLLNILKTYQTNIILEEALKKKKEGKTEDAAKLLEFIVLSDNRIEKYSYKLSLWKQNLEI